MRHPIQLVTLLLCVAVFLGVQAGPAWAHGGQIRGPGDSVRPGLREPSDPTPPPPPPPSDTPTTPSTPATPAPSPVGPSTPTTPGVMPPATTPGTGGLTRGRQTADSYADWTYWYAFNQADIENLKWSLYHPMSSGNELFRSGEARGFGSRGGETRWTEKRVRAVVVPALLWAMDPANTRHQDIESAAYIALAKIINDPAHIDTLLTGLVQKPGRGRIILESSALALGLLRRAHPDDQFSARDLDRVRERLFAMFEDADYPDRSRGFAALALGLLGDQPTGSGSYAADGKAAARATTARLFELFRGRYANEDLHIGLLMAVGMQPPASLQRAQRELLGACALKGRVGKSRAGDLTRSYAALALGRIGTANDIQALGNMVTARRGGVTNVKRSAAIGLGLLGRLVPGADRVRVARLLLDVIRDTRDASTKNFALISLSYLLIEDADESVGSVIRETRADEVLLSTAERGSYLTRGFGALALGLFLRTVDDELDLESVQRFREKAVLTLRAGLAAKSLDKKTRAAFVTALGIARDVRSRESIRTILADRGSDKMLRGYAAVSLGLIGRSTPEIVRTIADAMRERSSVDLRRQAATALGMLGNPTIPGSRDDAVDLLLAELEDSRSQSHMGQVVLALARVGDHRAVDGLVEILKDARKSDLSRALACAGLGLIGDLEWIPSMARGSKNVNYRASTDLMNEFLSIL